MTDDQIRIKVAEACGWTCCGCVAGKEPHGLPPHRNISDYKTDQVLAGHVPIETIPNYLNDLNACAEFEKTLTDGEFKDYFTALQDQVPFGRPSTKRRHVCCASARQRCEAFLRTLGKWEDK